MIYHFMCVGVGGGGGGRAEVGGGGGEGVGKGGVSINDLLICFLCIFVCLL